MAVFGCYRRRKVRLGLRVGIQQGLIDMAVLGVNSPVPFRAFGGGDMLHTVRQMCDERRHRCGQLSKGHRELFTTGQSRRRRCGGIGGRLVVRGNIRHTAKPNLCLGNSMWI